MLTRRSLITRAALLIAAPSIVRAESLMRGKGDIYKFWENRMPILPPLEAFELGTQDQWLSPNGRVYMGVWTHFGQTGNVYTDPVIGFRKYEIV